MKQKVRNQTLKYINMYFYIAPLKTLIRLSLNFTALPLIVQFVIVWHIVIISTALQYLLQFFWPLYLQRDTYRVLAGS